MKKIIICLLLLIPILVILTIDASGKLIVSASVDLPAESVVIKRNGEERKSDEINLEEYKGTENRYTLFYEVFPGIATDEMVWTSSNPKVAKVVKDEKKENAANVEFFDYGSVDILCSSQKNTSLSASITLYVGGKLLDSVAIGDADKGEYAEYTLDLWEQKNFFAFAKPAKSVLGEKCVWSSSDPEVAAVDDNGVVSARRTGKATITATFRQEIDGEERVRSAKMAVTVTDTDKKGFTERAVYVLEKKVNLAPYLSAGWVISGGTEIDLEEEREVTIEATKGDKKDRITVVRLESAKTLIIENYYILTDEGGALSSPIALRSADIRLRAYAFDDSNPVVTWKTSDVGVIQVGEDGRVEAIGSGKAVVYPVADGYERQSVEIEVCYAVESFRLADVKDKVGVMQEKVYGNLTYLNGKYTDQFTVAIESVYPADVGPEAFTFYSSNESVATVNAKGIVTFAKDVEGQEVTIHVTAYDQTGMLVEASRTFRLVNGVNIGVGVEQKAFDREKNEEPDFSVYADLKEVLKDPSVHAVVLHSDVYYPSREKGGSTILNPTASFYGNGKKLDGQFYINSVEETEKLILWDFNHFENMSNLDVGFYNLYFQSRYATSDDSKKEFTELAAKGGGALGTRGSYPEGCSFNLTVRGCVFQYAYGHVNLAIGDSFFDGCIFRNNSASAIVIQQSSYGVANAKIRNCIFSNTIAPVGIVCGNFDDILDRIKKNEKPVRFGRFELEGENYVYNWKKLEDVQMDLLPQGLADATANSLVTQFNGYLTKVIHEAFMVSDVGNVYIDDEDQEWLNFSFLSLGIWLNLNPQFNAETDSPDSLSIHFDPTKYKCFEVNAADAPSVASLKAVTDIFGLDLSVNKTYHIVCRDDEGNFNTYPGEDYKIDEATYARLGFVKD